MLTIFPIPPKQNCLWSIFQVELIAKLHSIEKPMILGLFARLDVVQSGHADDSLPDRVGEEEWLQRASKGRFCELKSFAISSVDFLETEKAKI